MSDLPLVTAVIPVYNGEDYLPDAIQSVLSQTYQAIECLVVDDGSSDSSAGVARSFEPVRCISQSNAGVSNARNAGAAQAKGEFVAFLDADDLWLPEKIERQIEMMSARPDLGLTYTGLQIVDETLEPLGVMHSPPGEKAFRNSLLMELPVVSVAQTSVIRKGVFDGVGGFDERMTTSADTDLACRVSLEHAVDGIDEPLVLYRQHDSQMHHDAGAMERDMNLLFEKIFVQASPQVRSLERRARANLGSTLGLAYLHDGQIVRSFRHFSRSALSDPTSLLRVVRKRMGRSG